jgi:hypothetical protein
MSEREFSRLERELLANAVEGTYLIEIRNDVGDTGLSVEDYRVQAGGSLKRLVEDGLIDVSTGRWQSDDTRPLGVDELHRRLDDGSAWDPDIGDLVTPVGGRCRCLRLGVLSREVGDAGGWW